MTNPPEIPKDIIESYKKLSEAKQKRLEFMAAYPEYLLDKNREDLLNGIDLIRKDFQKKYGTISPRAQQSFFQSSLENSHRQSFRRIPIRSVCPRL